MLLTNRNEETTMVDDEYLEGGSGVVDVPQLVEQFGGVLISDKVGVLVIERPPHGFVDDHQDLLTRMIHQFDPAVWIFFQNQSPGHPAQG